MAAPVIVGMDILAQTRGVMDFGNQYVMLHLPKGLVRVNFITHDTTFQPPTADPINMLARMNMTVKAKSRKRIHLKYHVNDDDMEQMIQSYTTHNNQGQPYPQASHRQQRKIRTPVGHGYG